MGKPAIAMTMGDPSGIGPEIALKVLAEAETYEICRPVVVGDVGVIENTCRLLGLDREIKPVGDVSSAGYSPSTIEVVTPEGLRVDNLVLGKVDPAMGKAAALCLEKAYALAADGQIQGVVAAPLNKQAFHLAGYNYFDDLEYLAELTESPDPLMLGAIGPSLWTIAVTGHVPFRAIPELLRKELVLKYIHSLHGVLTRVGFSAPADRRRRPQRSRRRGRPVRTGGDRRDRAGHRRGAQPGNDAVGPCPADTVFVRAQAGEFVGVVCMYHDQANIGRKLLATMKGATIYLGLPVVCGTTAHGTAHDKAGKGISDPGSLRDALRYAVSLARR